MLLQVVKNRVAPAMLASDWEEIVGKANALFQAEESKDLSSFISNNIEKLRHYDVPRMERAVAIVMWGRSGSLLLASYFDGHEDVIALPETSGYNVYRFFDRYKSLPLRYKLLGYPVFEPNYTRFFEGDYAISRTRYYAAVEAILKFCQAWPCEFLQSRRAFFLLVHIAYHLALGRRPVSSRPLIAYAQHFWNSTEAKRLRQDFPQAKFIHTIRDPISACDSFFHFHANAVERFILLPYSALNSLVGKDRPQPGMESRTRAVRFEDLHSHTHEVMRSLADWLDLDHQPTLFESTFNGIPYVVRRDGTAWSGPRPQQLQRCSRHLSWKDRAVLYSVLYENFVSWNYPCPSILRYRTVSYVVFFSLFLFPTKMEITGAKAVFKRNIIPALREGKFGAIVTSLVLIVRCRLQTVSLLALAFVRRCAKPPVLLRPERKWQQSERGDGTGELPEA